MMTEHQLTEMVLRVMRQQLDEKMRLSPQGREGLRKQQQGTTDHRHHLPVVRRDRDQENGTLKMK